MSIFDVDADQVIAKQIDRLCDQLDMTRPTDSEFTTIVDAIAKLRASLNSPIIESK